MPVREWTSRVRRRYRTRLVAGLLLLTLPVMIIIVIVLTQTATNRMRSNALQFLQNEASLVAAQIDSYMQERWADIRIMATAVEHVPPGPQLTPLLAKLPVGEAAHDQATQPGRVYVAPAGHHLRLAADHRLELSDDPATVHRPSADELFTSVAAAAGPAGVGVLLTGMGRDGATGLLAMRRAGATTLVQDKNSSAVFGMPQAALEVGAADHGDSLDTIAAMILASVSRFGGKR